MKLFVFGYFGCGNLGDEAILRSFASWCAANVPGAEIIAQTSDVEHTMKNHRVAGAVHKYNFPGVLKAVRGCDAVVAPGGGLLQDSTSLKSVLYYLALIRAAVFFRKPVFMLSQGMGPLHGGLGRKLAGRVLKLCSYISVRDEGSLKLLRELGLPEKLIESSGDIVLLGAPESCGGTASGGDGPLRIGLSLRPTAHLEHITGLIMGCLMRLREKRPIELHLFALNRDDDHPIMEGLLARVRQCSGGCDAKMIEGAAGALLSVAEMESEVSQLDVMIGMRLHSLVFAARCGVPFVGLSYDPKVAAFAHECGQCVVENLAAAEPLELMHGIEAALGKREQCSGAMSSGVERMRITLHRAMERFRSKLFEQTRGPRPVMGVPVSRTGIEGAMEGIYQAAGHGEKLQVVTVNPEMLMLARRDEKFRGLLLGSGLNTADGIGVALAYMFKYGAKIGRAPGVEMAERLLAESRGRGLRIFLLGARPEVVEAAARRAEAMESKPIIAGYHHGYIKDMNPGELVEKINAADPHIVLAGMGSPMQEYWIADNMEKINASVFIGVGGTFDVLSGMVKRAPEIYQKLGLEWLHRAVTQPSRLRRMAVLPLFLILSAIQGVAYRLRITR